MSCLYYKEVYPQSQILQAALHEKDHFHEKMYLQCIAAYYFGLSFYSCVLLLQDSMILVFIFD